MNTRVICRKESYIIKEIIIQKLSRNEIIQSWTETWKPCGTFLQDNKEYRIVLNIPENIINICFRDLRALGLPISQVQSFTDSSVFEIPRSYMSVAMTNHIIPPRDVKFDKNSSIVMLGYRSGNINLFYDWVNREIPGKM